jgi:hypothetical protein
MIIDIVADEVFVAVGDEVDVDVLVEVFVVVPVDVDVPVLVGVDVVVDVVDGVNVGVTEKAQLASPGVPLI